MNIGSEPSYINPALLPSSAIPAIKLEGSNPSNDEGETCEPEDDVQAVTGGVDNEGPPGCIEVCPEREHRLLTHPYLAMPETRGTVEIMDVDTNVMKDGIRNARLTFVHSDTGQKETVDLPLKDPGTKTIKLLNALKGEILDKPIRTLISGDLGVLYAMITPYEALRLLMSNTFNRPMAVLNVERLRELVLNGEILLLSDAIALDYYGRLYNGQHRLFTILLTGVPMPLALMWGHSSKARWYADRPLLRTNGDTADMRGRAADEGEIPSGKTIDACLKMICKAHGGEAKMMAPEPTFTSMTTLYMAEFEWIVAYIGSQPRYKEHRKMRTSLVAALMMAHHSFPELAPSFAELVLQPTYDGSWTAIGMLKKYLAEKPTNDFDIIYKVLLTFLTYREGLREKTNCEMGDLSGKSDKRSWTPSDIRKSLMDLLADEFWCHRRRVPSGRGFGREVIPQEREIPLLSEKARRSLPHKGASANRFYKP